MKFGKLKKKVRVEKFEKYDFPVLTVKALADKGKNNYVEFNKAAIALLGLEENEYVGFAEDENIIHIDALSEENKKLGYKIHKGNKCISDKTLNEYMWDFYNVSCDEDFEVEICVYEDGSKTLHIIADPIEDDGDDNEAKESTVSNGLFV